MIIIVQTFFPNALVVSSWHLMLLKSWPADAVWFTRQGIIDEFMWGTLSRLFVKSDTNSSCSVAAAAASDDNHVPLGKEEKPSAISTFKLTSSSSSPPSSSSDAVEEAAEAGADNNIYDAQSTKSTVMEKHSQDTTTDTLESKQVSHFYFVIHIEHFICVKKRSPHLLALFCTISKRTKE